MYHFLCFGVHDCNRGPVQQAESNESLLGVDKSVVFVAQRGAAKNLPSILEIQVVDAKIPQTLYLVPGNAYRRSVYTLVHAGKRYRRPAIAYSGSNAHS